MATTRRRSRSNLSLPVSPAMAAGLFLLNRAYHDAEVAGQSPWGFAVEIDTLHRAGVSNMDLRSLLSRGLIEHAWENAESRAKRRAFNHDADCKLTPRSCFILTPAGVAAARSACQEDTEPAVAGARDGEPEPGGREGTPHWDRGRWELTMYGVLVLKLQPRAEVLGLLLEAFEEQAWQEHIDDPLSPKPGRNAARRLHDAIKRLNRGLRPGFLRFHGDGTGRGLTWERLPSQNS